MFDLTENFAESLYLLYVNGKMQQFLSFKMFIHISKL